MERIFCRIQRCSGSVGSDQWFEHRIGQHKAAGLSPQAAVEATVKEWEAVNRAGGVVLVESNTPSIIRSIQERGIPTMGLTARAVTFMEDSLKQLTNFDVDFTRSTISQETITIQETDTATFKEGLLSVGGNNKGTILVKLMSHLGFKPSRVIFVDDKVKNVTNVDNALNAVSIPSFAFRYGAADPKVKAFDGKLADFQFNYFVRTGVVLSDAQAKKLMNQIQSR